MTHTFINSKAIILSDTRPKGAVRSLLSGRAWEIGPRGDSLDLTQSVNLSDVSSRLSGLMAAVNTQFVDRAEMISAVAVALAAGEHCFIYGPPGTAKTKVIETLTAGIGGVFGERQITAETTTDEVFGPIDAIAFSQGQYTRRWAGIATSDIFYINEVWEASSTVTNIFKTALESRIVHDGDVIRSIPLLSAIADSNHIPSEKGQQADWDRFLVRLAVGYIRDAGQFADMLTADAGGVEVGQGVTPDEIRLLAAASELLALDPPAALKEAMVDLWRELGQNGRSVSDRRWRKTLKLACAYALLSGETPEPRHLSVARWTLWSDLDEKANIENIVLSKTDPFAGMVLDVEALLADLKQARDTTDRSDAMARQDIVAKGRKLERETKALIAEPGANGYKGRLEAVVSQANQIWNEVLDW